MAIADPVDLEGRYGVVVEGDQHGQHVFQLRRRGNALRAHLEKRVGGHPIEDVLLQARHQPSSQRAAREQARAAAHGHEHRHHVDGQNAEHGLRRQQVGKRCGGTPHQLHGFAEDHDEEHHRDEEDDSTEHRGL